MMHRRHVVRPIAAVTLLSVIAGCERSDPVATSLDAANREIAMVSFGADLPAPDKENRALHEGLPDPETATRLTEFRRKQYEEVLRSVAPAGGSTNPGRKAAASLVTARVRYGQALDGSRVFYDLERAARRQLSAISSESIAWQDAVSVAGARETFDPEPELARIDGALSRLATDLQAARQERARTQKSIDDLRAQAKELLDQARGERIKEAEIRERSIRSGPVEAAELTEQATVHRRAADGLEAQASRLLARVDTLTPEVAEIDLRISMLTTQQSLYGSARQSVLDRDRLIKQAAANARADAAAAAERLQSAADALERLRSEEILPAAESAASAFEQVVSACAPARSAAPQHASLLIGEAQQARGNLLLTHARGLDLYARVLSEVASAEGLPLASTLRDRAASAAERASNALAVANEAFVAARDAYNAADRGAGQLDGAKAKLDELIAATAVDAAPGETEPPAGDAPPEPTGG